MEASTTIKIASTLDISKARQNGKDIAQKLGFSMVDQVRIKTIVSELARNIYLYAKLGEIVIETAHYQGKAGIKIVAKDQGPGIQDINKALEPGYTTSQGMGAGLSGVKNIADEFEIESCPGSGTTIVVTKWTGN
ncbi:serine/threonine protein kinase [Mesobacillus campisalis]|uniref:Serine/threonine protein kinase n=1 Tax=Mesobacillus campisalis TaxID=1408103 RepID=A0A0M2SYB6_9BACI|nr:anti-sigma regulatory factor [Mesobacillus campisalis]KKK38701.1 serine/threonine protein kinase [Mesobacillus campisalis]